jgi:CheY-like chemotaxis protein
MSATILVVDDDDATRGVIVRRLERSGYKVIQARGGEPALRRYHEAPVDLVLTDILMPDIDGLELIAALRRDFPTARVVSMSGAASVDVNDVLDEAQRLGVRGRLLKPFTSAQLINVVRSALEPGGVGAC